MLKQSSLRCGTARELPRPHSKATSQQTLRMRGRNGGFRSKYCACRMRQRLLRTSETVERRIPTGNPQTDPRLRLERPRAGVPRAVPQRSEDCLSTGPLAAAVISQVELRPQPCRLATRRLNYCRNLAGCPLAGRVTPYGCAQRASSSTPPGLRPSSRREGR